MKVAIRAGHGASDPGAVNGQYYEKDIALRAAKGLDRALRAQGIETIMLRKEDEAITIYAGAQIANREGADYYVSLHCNSASASSARGTEVYYHSGKPASKELAEDVLGEWIAEFGMRNRGAKTWDGLKDLKYPKMPAILLEMGFISNDQDLQIMLLPDFPERAGRAITKGICRAAGIEYKEEDTVVNERVYHYTNEVPEWGRAVIQKLLDKGYFKGRAPDDLDLTESMLRVFVTMDRAGAFDR